MPITGPDCSHHQGTVDWAQVKVAGHAFGICKLTDNLAYRFVAWGRANVPLVRAAGLIPGAYHWLHTGDGAAQARVYVAEVNRLGGFTPMLPVVDVEVDEDGTHPSYPTVLAYCAEHHRLVPGRTLIVYTGRWFWVDILGNPPAPPGTVLWHSEYEPSLAEVADGPELDGYGGWGDATLWQFTSNDQGLGMDVPGVSGSCDLNRFFGTTDDLLALAGGGDDMGLTADETKAVVKEAVAELWAKAGSAPRVAVEDVLERIAVPTTGAGKAFQSASIAALTKALADPDVIRPLAAAIVAEAPGGDLDVAQVEAALVRVLAKVQTVGHLQLAES